MAKSPKIKKPAKDKSNDYIDQTRLNKELAEYRKQFLHNKENDLPRPQMSEYIGTCIMLIATNMAKSGAFASYTYKDEFICNAIECMVRYAHNFDIDKAGSNTSYSYLSMLSWRKFLKTIAAEHKQNKIKFRAVSEAIQNDREHDYGNNPEVQDYLVKNTVKETVKKEPKVKKEKETKSLKV